MLTFLIEAICNAIFRNILKISTYVQKYWTQGSSNKNEENSLTGGRDPSGGGYFIFSFKDSKIKIVNITPVQQKMITVIIKRHCQVSKEGWEHGRSMTYFFKITKIGNSSRTFALSQNIYISVDISLSLIFYDVCAEPDLREIWADPPGDWPVAHPVQGGLGAHDPHRHRRGQGTCLILRHYYQTYLIHFLLNTRMKPLKYDRHCPGWQTDLHLLAQERGHWRRTDRANTGHRLHSLTGQQGQYWGERDRGCCGVTLHCNILILCRLIRATMNVCVWRFSVTTVSASTTLPTPSSTSWWPHCRVWRWWRESALGSPALSGLWWGVKTSHTSWN